MLPQANQLSLRHHLRHDCDLSARLVVDTTHAETVVIARRARGADGAIPAKVVDCSLGGLGLECGVFFPKGCRLLVIIQSDPLREESFEGEFVARVQRVMMKGGEPSYRLGALFVGYDTGSEADLDQAVSLQRLMKHVTDGKERRALA